MNDLKQNAYNELDRLNSKLADLDKLIADKAAIDERVVALRPQEQALLDAADEEKLLTFRAKLDIQVNKSKRTAEAIAAQELEIIHQARATAVAINLFRDVVRDANRTRLTGILKGLFGEHSENMIHMALGHCQDFNDLMGVTAPDFSLSPLRREADLRDARIIGTVLNRLSELAEREKI